MNFDVVFTVKKEFGQDDFLRELLIKLGTDKDTPADVVGAQFQEVKESVKEVIVCTAFVEGQCTASVGYDRQEPYIAYESYKEKVGDSYVTRQRPVTQYRTVTDWQMFQTAYSGEAVGVSPNSDEFRIDNDDIILALTTANEDNILVEGEAVVNKSGVSNALTFCKTKVEIQEVNFPGDRRKDVSYKSNATIQRLSCYKLPCYEVTYTYKDKNYTATCFACGNLRIDAQTPPNDVNITAIAKKNTQKEEKTQRNTWILFTASLIAAAALCILLKFPWLFPIPIVLLLKAKKDSDTYSKRYQGYSDYYSKNVAEAKATALKEALEKYGFEPQNTAAGEPEKIPDVPGAMPLKSIKGRVILSWVLSVILVIVSLFTANSVYQQNLHSPKQVDIAVVEKQAYYDPEGYYYIELGYEIETKKLGVEDIKLRVRVSDKKGKELGTINSTLSDLNIAKRDETIITTTLKESRPEKNAFFVELYERDLSELKFEIEIGSIDFSDGKHYYDADFYLG